MDNSAAKDILTFLNNFVHEDITYSISSVYSGFVFGCFNDVYCGQPILTLEVLDFLPLYGIGMIESEDKRISVSSLSYIDSQIEKLSKMVRYDESGK